jgi:Methylamine utilisation protein MauE
MDWNALGTDPITVGTLTGALALITFAAAWHKLAEPDAFLSAVAAYGLLPSATVTAVARILPGLELALGAGILLPVTRTFALMGLVGLFLLYAMAMAINLARGRRDIDCGCGGKSQPISWVLVVRNLVLCTAALIASQPALERPMDWVDATTLILGVLAFFSLYRLSDELLRQSVSLSRMHEDGH